MPTRSPDVVTEQRITLGRWEREQVKELQDAVNIALIGTGVGIAAVGVGGTYVAYKIGKAIYEWGDDAVEWLTAEQPDSPSGKPVPPRWVQILLSGP